MACWRAMIVAFGLALLPPAILVGAEPAPPAGLMWQKTGLPAVFPLLVRSDPGRDHMLLLIDPATGEPMLAAYVRGGEVFRVLVPPGNYRARLASGSTWRNEAEMFGAETEIMELPETLTFAVRDASTKSGHMIDLRQARDGPVLSARHICQRVAIEAFPRPLPPFDALDGFETRLTDPGTLQVHPDARFDPERATGQEHPTIPSRYAPYFSDPAFEIVNRPC